LPSDAEAQNPYMRTVIIVCLGIPNDSSFQLQVENYYLIWEVAISMNAMKECYPLPKCIGNSDKFQYQHIPSDCLEKHISKKPGTLFSQDDILETSLPSSYHKKYTITHGTLLPNTTANSQSSIPPSNNKTNLSRLRIPPKDPVSPQLKPPKNPYINFRTLLHGTPKTKNQTLFYTSHHRTLIFQL